MQSSVHSSDLLLLKTQATLSQKRIESIKNAISEKDFHSFAVTVMKESNTFHAICQDTFPPIQPPYMTEKSHKIVQFVHSLNSFLGHTVACYTFDAGPNAFIFVLEKDIKVFLTFFLTIFPKPLNDVPHISKLIERYDIKLPCKNHINLQMKPDSTFLFETLYLCKVGAGPVIVE
ncbi:hypothetical protein HZS_7545 [Henneguya salminicola]|nr:hypothetical protein HZS_7545 [Henneguya salminicola]